MGNKLLVLALSGLCLAFAACSDDEPADTPTATGGNAGSGGTTGGTSGGSAGKGGTGGSAGAGTSGSGGGAGDPGFVEPMKLSETGLYSDIASDTIADGVEPFQPQFQLWSDAATKRRFLYLPPGTQIDTTDMDYWVYPVGTKVWKEFTRGDVRVETRLLQKISDDEWFMMAYRWNDAGTDADAVPAGESNARGTPHDIPSQELCTQCHGNMPDKLLGVSALQLSHDLEGVKLAELMADDRLSAPPAAPFTMIGNQVEAAALGYMHANCGHCHNPESVVYFTIDMELWLPTAALEGAVTETPTYLTTVNQETTSPTSQPDWNMRVVPGEPDQSGIYRRATFVPGGQGGAGGEAGAGSGPPPGQNLRMPPIATEDVDPTGSAAIQAWIESLL